MLKLIWLVLAICGMQTKSQYTKRNLDLSPKEIAVYRLNYLSNNAVDNFKKVNRYKDYQMQQINKKINGLYQDYMSKNQQHEYQDFLKEIYSISKKYNASSTAEAFCLSENSGYPGPNRIRKLTVLKCVDSSARTIVIDTQWTSLEGFIQRVFEEGLADLTHCDEKSEKRSLNCYTKTADALERMSSGAKNLMQDFVEYLEKTAKNVKRAFQKCIKDVNHPALRSYKHCVKNERGIAKSNRVGHIHLTDDRRMSKNLEAGTNSIEQIIALNGQIDEEFTDTMIQTEPPNTNLTQYV